MLRMGHCSQFSEDQIIQLVKPLSRLMFLDIRGVCNVCDVTASILLGKLQKLKRFYFDPMFLAERFE